MDSKAGTPREIVGLRAKGNLAPSPNFPNNDTQTKSTTVCHKQGISLCLCLCTGKIPPEFGALQLRIKL